MTPTLAPAAEDARATDPRPARSRAALIDAATEALGTSDPSNLSITTLVKTAGVSRPTFYQHFTDVHELIHAAALTKISAAFDELLPATPTASVAVFTSEVSTNLLKQLQADADFYRNVLAISGNSSLVAELIDFLSHRFLSRPAVAERFITKNPDLTSDYTQFVAAGVAWLAVRWLATDFTGEHTAEATGERLAQMMRAAIS
ncbi:MAG TPA: TetR/AcrR family transcriptional regulator [Candidatus Rothia avistercoris]|uniref:TetR/AcrR family transcriptional regulator n=1 Tax=Candidatus Rothia avistercoris TaxID=2840479 RepID=A0A9D2UFT2_9MICC|nr:TetR/AcrR family transcriptional regulator [Candidatus Rothia avistercoris]